MSVDSWKVEADGILIRSAKEKTDERIISASLAFMGADLPGV